MGIKTNNGFTIIEVMLFLAVTGALTITILAGAGVSITQQRYRDSVNSLKSVIQDQYAEVSNVVNDRNQDWTCTTAGNVLFVEAAAGQPRGTSDCVVLGRIVTINETGTTLTSSNVIGYRTPGVAAGASDLAELDSNYAMTISPVNPETTDMSWGAQVVKAKSTNAQPLSIMIIRSPLSGALITFTAEGIQTNPKTMLNAGNMSAVRNLCVNPDGVLIGAKRLEVRISGYATSQTGVSVPTEGESVCD